MILVICGIIGISFFIIMKYGLSGYLRLLIKYNPPIAVLVLNLSSFSLVKWIGEILDIGVIKNLDISTRIAVDSAVITIVFMIIAQVFNEPGSINAIFTNRLDVDTLQLRKERTAKIDLNINIDYKYKWLRSMIHRLGGLSLHIINSEWTSLEIDRRDEYGQIINYDNPATEVIIDLEEAVRRGDNTRILYLTLCIQPNKFVKNDGKIKTEVRLKNETFFNKLLLAIFININCTQQKIVYREEAN